ncbi:MAG: hypothetical protein QM762_24865 [Chryseolinea sp.]
MKHQPSESTISIVPHCQINAQPKLYNSLASTFLDFFAKPYTPTYNVNNTTHHLQVTLKAIILNPRANFVN